AAGRGARREGPRAAGHTVAGLPGRILAGGRAGRRLQTGVGERRALCPPCFPPAGTKPAARPTVTPLAAPPTGAPRPAPPSLPEFAARRRPGGGPPHQPLPGEPGESG